ncbi:hypothetical protein BASA61_002551 [Batrachochytrium salamandrivorans]|nr:hypothetical protein BASA62_002995 [Batrachochytrium salamandrivorans]KAH6599453.1 hypothetical protein BASA61_002551 [Batrachochytrium salamandrivorans]
MIWEESKPYLLIEENDDHLLFTEEEDKYFKSEYRSVKKLGQGSFGAVHLAIKKSTGLKVVYKLIRKGYIPFYTFESSPPSECHSTEIPALYGKYAGARCMPPRPQGLLLPFEVKVQEYLSQPGYENLYAPRVIDYIITEDAYILVMEYYGEDWMDLDGYMKTHGKFSVDKVRPIIKEVVTALISLKKLGILHGDIAARNVLYNDKTGSVKLIDFGFSEPLEGCNQGSSVQENSSNSESGSSGEKFDAGGEEISDIKDIGNLLYFLLTLKNPFQDPNTPREKAVKDLRNRLDDFESQPAVNAVDLVASLYKCGSYQIATIEDTLQHPFFTSQ